MPTIGSTVTSGATNFLPYGGWLAQRWTMPENGWITTANVFARLDPESSDNSITLRIGVWDSSQTLTYNGPLKTLTRAQGYAWRTDSGLAVRAGATSFWIGVVVPVNQAYNYIEYRRNTAVAPNVTTLQDDGYDLNPLPNPLYTSGSAVTEPYSFYVDYVANVAPLQPTWLSPAQGASVALTPTWQVNLLQGADAALDTIDNVQLQIRRADNDTVVYDQILATTGTERTNGYLSRAPVTLSPSTAYLAKARTRDSWGSWSTNWSIDLGVTTVAAPQATPTAPVGKINAISGYNYTAAYTHLGSLNADRAQVLVKNASGVTLYDSGEVTLSPTVAPGATVTVPEWHTDLLWATSYQWQIRLRDTATSWGGYSTLAAFNTNAPPSAPTNLSPANNKTTPLRDFSATVSDPDGDAITAAQINLVDVTSGNVVVSGYPKAMTVSGSTATFSAPSGDMVLTRQYKWQARATDGNPSGYGAYSDFAFMTYENVPIVAMTGPISGRTNIMHEPSAEYEPGTFWTETARSTGVDEINRQNDADVAYGDWAWRATASVAGDNRFRMTDYQTVDITKAHPFFVWVRRESGTSATHFNVLCYNNANTLLGTLQPNSEGALNGTNAAAVWTRYGGIVYHNGSTETVKWPTGTTKYKVEFTPSRNSAAVVRFDAFSRSEMPALTATEWASAKAWLGYADGDMTGYGSGGYTWTSTPGDSTSNVLSRLTGVPTSVVINYSHPSASAKTGDRLIIQRWSSGAWVQILDTNPTLATLAGTRTAIPIPADTLSNETRYRLQVQARDSAAAWGEGDWVEFDVSLTGPAPLELTVVDRNVTKAEIGLEYVATALAPGSFDRYELQVWDLTTGERWIEDYSTNPATTRLAFYSPISSHDYELGVRQVEIVGAERIEGRFSAISANVDYFPYFFVKDADNPSELYVAYESEASTLGTTSEEVPAAIFAPWGAEAEIVLTRRRVAGASGTINAQFYPDALSQEDHEARYAKMQEILARRRTIILLQHAPDTTSFHAAIVGATETGFMPPNTKTISFNWRKVAFERDVYARNGAT